MSIPLLTTLLKLETLNGHTSKTHKTLSYMHAHKRERNTNIAEYTECNKSTPWIKQGLATSSWITSQQIHKGKL